MATMIPNIPLAQFKLLKVHQLRALKCCEVTADGEYLFTFINPRTDFIRMEAEYKGQLSNSVGGKDLAECQSMTIDAPVAA